MDSTLEVLVINTDQRLAEADIVGEMYLLPNTVQRCRFERMPLSLDEYQEKDHQCEQT